MSSAPRFATLALAALLALPGVASAQSRYSTQPSMRLGGLIGFDSGDLDGLALRLDGEMDLQRISPNVMLVGVGSVGWSHLSDDLGYGYDVTNDVFTIMPAARLAVALAPQVGVYGDLGLGLYHASLEVDVPDPFTGLRRTVDDSATGLAMRIGAGAYFNIAPKVRLVGEIALHPYFGDYDDDTFTFMVGATFGL